MAATVQIRKLTGENGSITSTDISSGSIQFGTSDEATSPSSIPVPSSGSNYSYWSTLQLNATAAPDNALNNVKFYSDGTNGFGTGVDAIVTTASGYASAVGTLGTSGSLLNNTGHDGLTGLDGDGATSPLFDFSSGCKLAVAGSIAATTGSFADRVVVQLNVIDTAGAGNSGEETLTFEWDES